MRDRSVLRTAEYVVSTQQADATILLDIRGGEYYTLNGIGSYIWMLLSEGTTVATVIERLACECEVPTERVSADVHHFIEQLHRSKLITH